MLGSDFYVMERLDGLILRKDLPFELAAEEASTLCEHAWEALVRLHEVDVAAVPDLAALGRGDGYVERQVAGLDRPAVAGRDRRPRRLERPSRPGSTPTSPPTPGSA